MPNRVALFLFNGINDLQSVVVNFFILKRIKYLTSLR
jgi:hypothetical protein